MNSLTSVENQTTNGMPVMVAHVSGGGPSVIFPSSLLGQNPHEPFMYGFAGSSIHLTMNNTPDPRIKCAYFFGSLSLLPASPLFRDAQVEIHERVYGEEGAAQDDLGNEGNTINNEAWAKTWDQFERTLELLSVSRNGILTSTALVQVFLVGRTNGHFFTSRGKVATTLQQLEGFLEPFVCSNLMKLADVRGTELDGSGNMAEDDLMPYDGVVVLMRAAMVPHPEYCGVHDDNMFYSMLRDMFMQETSNTQWITVGHDPATYQLLKEANGVARYSIVNLNVFAATRRIENLMKARFDLIGAALWPDGLALSQKLTPAEWNLMRESPLVQQLENEITTADDPNEVIMTIQAIYSEVANGRVEHEIVQVPALDLFSDARRLSSWINMQTSDVQTYGARFSPIIWTMRRYANFQGTEQLLAFLHSRLQYLDSDGIDGDDENINAVNIILWPFWPYILRTLPDQSPTNNLVYDVYATQIINAMWDPMLFTRFVSNDRLWIPLNAFRVEWLMALNEQSGAVFIERNIGKLAQIAAELR